ncbi:MAG TPA: insulinase family protein [Oceanospirillales bacterium]|nr:insulinase family protein [Oceanospirillales bacterium]
MFNKFKKTALICSLVAVSSMVMAKLPKGMEKVTTVEGISEYKLKNGLRVLLFPDVSQETITVNITYLVGSKHENYGETGMAHLLEHLVFKGTPRHKNIPKELTDHGAEPNGTTSTDRTNYFETFAANDKNLNWALDLEADRMVNSFIAQKDLDSEMSVVRNEFEMGENRPISVLIQRMMSVAYDWHNYGKTTIGARSDIENVNIKHLQDFYRKYYQPDNAVLVVAGKIDPDHVLKLIHKYFAKIKKPKRIIDPLYTEDPIQDGERQVTIRRPGDVQVVAAMYHVPAAADENAPAVELLTSILSDYKAGRLQKNLVKKGLAANAFGFTFQWAEPNLVTFMAQVGKDKDLTKAQDALLNTIEDIKNHPITQAELDQAKAKFAKSFEQSFTSPERVGKNLSEWISMGDWRLLFLNRDRIENTSLADVQKAAEEYLVNDNRTLGLFIPEQNPNRADSLKKLSQDEIKAMFKDFKGRKEVVQGEDFDPSFDNIDKRSHRTTLKNGAKVVLLPKKTRGDNIEAFIALDFGNEKDLFNKAVVAELMGDMLNRGTKKYNREQFQAERDKLKASIGVYSSSTGVNIAIKSNKENLPKVLDLIDEMLKQPRFDAKELEVAKQEQIVALEQQKQQPQSQVFRQLTRYLSPYQPGHPKYKMSIDEEIAAIKKVTVDDLQQFHKKFLGAQDADIAVIGNFDEKTIKTKLQKLLGNFDSKVPYARVKNQVANVDSVNKFIDTPDKAGAAFAAMMKLKMNDNNPDYPALVMANQMFGGGFISSRLANRLRQKDGLSYGAGSWFNASSYDDYATFGAYAICAPENLAKVEIGFKEELDKVLKDGFTQKELDDAKKAMLENNKLDRAKDNRLVYDLASKLDLDRTMAWDKAFEDKIKNLTLFQVNNAVKKYWAKDKISIIKAGDAKKALADKK